MKSIALTIDGKSASAPEGTRIMAAADQVGIRIPRLCHHPDLQPYGACRVCLVEDEKTGRLMASCVTPVGRDMAIRTDTPRVLRHRRNIVRLMIAEHPESCIVCSKGNRCQLRSIAARLGIGDAKLYPMPNPKDLEEANPFIIRDLTKCILCGKCIRADHELVGVGAIDYNLRGFRSRPSTVHEGGLEQSACTFCGTCVSMCPTGALSPKNTRFVGTPDRDSPTICGFCGVGCSLSLGVFGEEVVETNPAHRSDTVNGATLCVRGHFANDYLNASKRITQPGIRNPEGELVSASWENALVWVADRLSALHQSYGPQSVAFLGSSKCSNEENYLFQKIARACFKTNNIDTAAHFGGQTLWAHLDHRLGGRFRNRPLSGLERAEAIFALGTDPGHSVPVVGYHLKRGVKNGVPLIVADPVKSDLVPAASLWLTPSPGSDGALIQGLCALLFRKMELDAAPGKDTTEGFHELRKILSAHDVERTRRITGIDADRLRKAADMLHGKKISFVVGSGVLQQPDAARTLDALINLALMTGSVGDDGGGIYLMAQENNQVGAYDMGAVPHSLPGRQPLSDESARKIWERTWQVNISPDRGLDAARMIEEAEKRNLKALYILGENPVRSFPQPERVRKALQSIELLVVQDILSTETTALAHAVLPGVPFSEKGGSFTNLEGRIQTFDPAVAPRGESKPDWEILAILARKAGMRGGYSSPESIRDEIRRLVPAYGRLPRDGGSGWIESLADTRPILFGPVDPSGEPKRDKSFPYTAVLTTTRFHLGSGTRTGNSERIQSFQPDGSVALSTQDADTLGLEDGARVRVSSRWGTLEREVRRSRSLPAGIVCVPKAFDDNSALRLVDLKREGWKTVPVNVEPIT